jgi:methylglutaconyl-CoA hydratase
VSDELVHAQHTGAVRTLTLDSPHNRNALSSRLLNELADGLRDATADPQVRVIVITGAGSVFCSGADLTERNAAVTSRMPEILTTIRASGVPVIARVNGHTRAGGLGIIAVADLAVAPRGATFAFTEVRVGVAPAMILVPALSVVDRRFLTRMVLTGERFGADEAIAAGLLSEAVDDEAGLDRWVTDVVDSVLKSAPGAVAATKALTVELAAMEWSVALDAAQRRSAELFAGAEAAEGMDAFLNKRTPSWDVSAS